MILIDTISGCSLYLELYFGDLLLSKATGFLISHGGEAYLVTNWHVVTGRNADTGVCLDETNLAIPDRMRVTFHSRQGIGHWQDVDIPLYDNAGEKRWIEHPMGRLVDIAVLPLAEIPGVRFITLNLSSMSARDLFVAAGATVSVIGYPFGLRASSRWPIWKTGHVATDPDVDYEPGRPAFLIDATTREGMSGSPVLLRYIGTYLRADGTSVVSGGSTTRLLGVYSGRIHGEVEIGRVWRPFTIREALEGRLLFGQDARIEIPRRLDPCPCGSGRRFKVCHGQVGSGVDPVAARVGTIPEARPLATWTASGVGRLIQPRTPR